MNLRRLRTKGILAEYGRVLPGEGPSHTPGLSIGVAFTPQRQAHWSVGGKGLGGVIEPASVFVTPAEGLEWHAWDLVSDSIEIWLCPDRLRHWSQMHGGPDRVSFDLHDRIDDPFIVNLASRVRWLLCQPASPDESLAALGQELGEHYLRNYAGLRIPIAGRALDQRRLSRVLEHIEAHLHEPLDLDRLADVAAMSPFHFARCFKLATGSPPHVFVVARRMDRAAALFRAKGGNVAEVAAAVGFASLPHFRRHFRAHWGFGPGDFAAAGAA